MSDEAAKNKRPKGRSPSYPAIDLEEAIEKARQLYTAEGQHPASVDTVVRDWSYKSLNGPAALALAALKRFGLTDDSGVGPARRINVSDLAVDILENPDPAARREAIRTTALNPPIHRELWSKYGERLPSDQNIKWFLTRERGFTDTGATEFIPEYRSTIAYAHLFGAGTVETQTTDQEERENGISEPPAKQRRNRVSPASSDTRVYAVPVRAGTDVAVEGPFPLTEGEWTQFMAILTAMKPSLVSDEADPPQRSVWELSDDEGPEDEK